MKNNKKDILDVIQDEQDNYQANIVMEENIRDGYNFIFDKKKAESASQYRY